VVILITAGTFVLVVCLVLLLNSSRSTEKQAVQNRIDRYLDTPLDIQEEQTAYQQPVEQFGTVRIIIRQLSRYLESLKLSSLVEHKLGQAGILLRGSEFLVIWLGATLIIGLLAFVISGGGILCMLGGGVVGCFIPFLYLRRKATLRVNAFNLQLGDALVLIANALRTGYSFLQAVELVGREMLPPISVEFSRALKEMNFGVVTEDALDNMAKRIKSDDLELVITAVVIQRQIGGNLAEILDKIASTIRARVRLKGQIKTLTAQGRISGYVIGLMPFVMALLIYFVNPKYMSLLFTNPIGQMLVGIAVVMQVSGVWLISRIIDIEY